MCRAVLYASESYATMLNLRDCDPSVAKPDLDPSILQRGENGWRNGHPLLRIDLDDASGEVFELQVGAGQGRCVAVLWRKPGQNAALLPNTDTKALLNPCLHGDVVMNAINA